MVRNDKDYQNFRDALVMDFEGMDIDSKKQLSTLMRISGYRQTYSKETRRKQKLLPTQIQLNVAWDILKDEGIVKRKTGKFKTLDEYGQRATKDIFIRGKLYKKGEFIPHKKQK